MINAVVITNFRGIKQGLIDDLTMLSILVGPNNVGKSAVIDALLLGSHPPPQAQAIAQLSNRKRGLIRGEQWVLFREKGGVATQAEIAIVSGGETRVTTLTHAGGGNPQAQLMVGSFYPAPAQLKAKHNMTHAQSPPLCRA